MTDPQEPVPEFARLLATGAVPKSHVPGDTVKGTIVQIGEADLLVDIGGKSEASIARDEFKAEDGSLSVKVGDAIEATVVSVDGSGVKLSHRLTASAAPGRDRAAVHQMLRDAQQNGLAVEGKVTASVKGGYEVHVGGVRGFCPFSQIDVRRQEDPTLYFNKTFPFRIKEWDPRRKNLILTRRALLEEEIKKGEAEARAQMAPGDVKTGTVVSLQDFGAFVDIGTGVQGLLHVSEISHARVTHPSDVLSVGQTIQVQVLKIDKKRKKVSLTRKPLEADPWVGVSERFRVGQVLTGKVSRVAEFGAFLEVAPGIDGLLHVTELASAAGAPRRAASSAGRPSSDGRPGAPKKGAEPAAGGRAEGAGLKAEELVKVGQELKVQVLKVEEARRRISLGIASESAQVGERVDVSVPRVGALVSGKVERVEKFGVFVRLGPGRTGMIPNNEVGTPRGTDHRKMFPVGTELKAEVIETDPAGRKIRLSITKAQRREEREALERYRKEATRGGSLSTMADAFAALRKPPPSGEGS